MFRASPCRFHSQLTIFSINFDKIFYVALPVIPESRSTTPAFGNCKTERKLVLEHKI